MQPDKLRPSDLVLLRTATISTHGVTSRAVSVGVVVHSDCVITGHGPGVTTSSHAKSPDPRRQERHSKYHLLGRFLVDDFRPEEYMVMMETGRPIAQGTANLCPRDERVLVSGEHVPKDRQGIRLGPGNFRSRGLLRSL